MQINFFAEKISNDSLEEITCQATKKIKFSRCSFRNINVKQTLQILFFNNPNFFPSFLKFVNCKCIPFPEPWAFEKGLRFTFYRLRLQTPPYDDTQGRTDIKTRENHGKELYNVWRHFSLTCCQKCERQCSKNDLLPAIIRYSWDKKK